MASDVARAAEKQEVSGGVMRAATPRTTGRIGLGGAAIGAMGLLAFLAIGVGQMIWITVELIVVRQFHPVLQPGCFSLGLALAVLAYLWHRRNAVTPGRPCALTRSHDQCNLSVIRLITISLITLRLSADGGERVRH